MIRCASLCPTCFGNCFRSARRTKSDTSSTKVQPGLHKAAVWTAELSPQSAVSSPATLREEMSSFPFSLPCCNGYTRGQDRWHQCLSRKRGTKKTKQNKKTQNNNKNNKKKTQKGLFPASPGNLKPRSVEHHASLPVPRAKPAACRGQGSLPIWEDDALQLHCLLFTTSWGMLNFTCSTPGAVGP